MPARSSGHSFYSMNSEMAGKLAFPLWRKPRRSKILVPFQGTSEWLGACITLRRSPVWQPESYLDAEQEPQERAEYRCEDPGNE